MIVKEGPLTAALDRADPTIRLFLLHGSDESALQALARRLGKALGDDAERIDLDEAALREEPGRLAGEATSLSLFGNRRWIRATGADALLPAVEELLALTRPSEPVVVIASALKASSALFKRTADEPGALVYQGYKVDGRNAEARCIAIARAQGLRVEPRLAAQLAEAAANDGALIERECEKFALYLDAAPDRPRELTAEAVELLSADASEANVFAVVDAAFDGQPDTLMDELRQLGDGATNPIPILRLATRRALMLASLRASIEGGRSGRSVLEGEARYLKGRERDAVGRQVATWSANRLARVVSRLFAAEEALKFSAAGAVVAQQELLAIARAGAKLR